MGVWAPKPRFASARSSTISRFVAAATNKKPDQAGLGRASVKTGVRPRLFFQFRTMGSNPQEERGYRANRGGRSRGSVYDAVHKGGHYQRAREWFESPFWALVTAAKPSQEIYVDCLMQMIDRKGWYRATATEGRVGDVLFERRDTAFKGWTTDAHRTCLSYLVSAESLDDLAIACCMYREAYHAYRLDLAIALAKVVEMASHNFCEQIANPYDTDVEPQKVLLQGLLSRLVEDRILGDYWVTEADMPYVHSDQKPLTRKANLQRFVSWYVASRPGRPVCDLDYPIVSSGKRTQWVRKNADGINRELDIGKEIESIWRNQGIRRGSVANPIIEKRNAAIRKKYGRALGLLQAESDMLPIEGRRAVGFQWNY